MKLSASLIFLGVFIVNLALAILKLVWGYLSHSLTMIADGFHSLLDVLANFIGFIAVKISHKEPDSNHPYGHRKFEALAAIVISFFMFFASYEIFSESINRFLSHNLEATIVSFPSYLIMVTSVIANISVSKLELYFGKKLDNQLLISDAKHTASDLLASLMVFISLFAVSLKLPILDIVFSLLIVIFILKAGYDIILDYLGSLVDAAILDTEQVEALVLGVTGVVSCHNIRSRGFKDHIFLDLHIHVMPNLQIKQAHEIADLVENRLKTHLPNVKDIMVHIEDEGHLSST